MSSRWWEATSSFIHDDKNRHKEDVWTSDAWILGAIAQLMGTIQDHLCALSPTCSRARLTAPDANKEMTRSLLRTGAWESFLRSLRLEIRYSKRATRNQLSGSGQSNMQLTMQAMAALARRYYRSSTTTSYCMPTLSRSGLCKTSSAAAAMCVSLYCSPHRLTL